jgi:hypothetical protein
VERKPANVVRKRRLDNRVPHAAGIGEFVINLAEAHCEEMNRPVRTRIPGGVGGGKPQGSSLPLSIPLGGALSAIPGECCWSTVMVTGMVERFRKIFRSRRAIPGIPVT